MINFCLYLLLIVRMVIWGLFSLFNMIRQGSSGFVGEKMLLGNNGSDLFGDENRKGVFKVI